MKVELSEEQINSIINWHGCTENEFGTCEDDDELCDYLMKLVDNQSTE